MIGWHRHGAHGGGGSLWSVGRDVLRRQLVPQPTPIANGQLIEAGPYRSVRHPIYTSVLLLVAAATVRRPHALSFAILGLAVVFFKAKAVHEERLLAATYDDYGTYCDRVPRRLVPFLL